MEATIALDAAGICAIELDVGRDHLHHDRRRAHSASMGAAVGTLILLTFIFVFAHRPLLAPRWLGRVPLLPDHSVDRRHDHVEVTEPAGLIVTLHLLLFFAAAMVRHTELAKDRPSAVRLTDFYLCLSLGEARWEEL